MTQIVLYYFLSAMSS